MIRSRSGKDGPGKNRKEKWTRNPVAPGSQHRGFLAGPPFGAWVHYFKSGSRPCLREITECELVCDHCKKDLIPIWRGYTPYYTDQYAPYFVQITQDYEEAVNEITLHSPILITRGDLETDPIIITVKPWRTQPIPYDPRREKPVNLASFLLYTLWQDQALINWVLKPKYVAPEPNTPKQEDSLYNDPSYAKLARLARAEDTAKQESATLEEAMVNVINQATTPKPNGSPFKKPR
jgi:hypothetical protein